MTGRFPLAVLPTPLVGAPRLARALGLETLWVKRDDLTGFVAGGNKVRQVEYLVAEALSQGARSIVAGGGPGSNFCAVVAAGAKVAGLDCRLVMYGSAPRIPPPNLAICEAFGAAVEFTGDAGRDSVDKALRAAGEQISAVGGGPFVIPRGAANASAAAAFCDAAHELDEQLAEQGIVRPSVLVAAGSGTTAAGLAAAGRRWRLVVAAVSRSPDETASQIARLRDEVAAERGSAGSPFEVVDMRGPGYGSSSPDGEAIAALAAETEGLLLDPVFSAKAMAVLLGPARPPEPVVFWHTGGLPVALASIQGRATGDRG